MLESISSPSSSYLVTSFRHLIMSSFVSDMLIAVISETETLVNNKIVDSIAADSIVDFCQTLSDQRTPKKWSKSKILSDPFKLTPRLMLGGFRHFFVEKVFL